MVKQLSWANFNLNMVSISHPYQAIFFTVNVKQRYFSSWLSIPDSSNRLLTSFPIKGLLGVSVWHRYEWFCIRIERLAGILIIIAQFNVPLSVTKVHSSCPISSLIQQTIHHTLDDKLSYLVPEMDSMLEISFSATKMFRSVVAVIYITDYISVELLTPKSYKDYNVIIIITACLIFRGDFLWNPPLG